jgi:hypothetical protein
MRHRFGFAIVLGLTLAGLLCLAAVASGQTPERRQIVTASISTTVSSVIETSVDHTAPGIVTWGRRWKSAEKILQLDAAPMEKLAFVVRFNLGGIDEPPVGVDPRTGIRELESGRGLSFLTGYLGTTRQLEVSGSYAVKPYLNIQGGYMRYSLESQQESFHPNPGFNTGGWQNSYWSIDRYHGFEVGAAAHQTIEKVGLEADFMWAPRIGRHTNSRELSFGQVYYNDHKFENASTQGLRLSGRISYDLARHLTGSFGYSFRLLNTSWDSTGDTEQLNLRQATVGLHVGF